MSTPKTGRPTIFRDKRHKLPGFQLTDVGKRAYERKKTELEAIVRTKASVGDVVEYLTLSPAQIRQLVIRSEP